MVVVVSLCPGMAFGPLESTGLRNKELGRQVGGVLRRSKLSARQQMSLYGSEDMEEKE